MMKISAGSSARVVGNLSGQVQISLEHPGTALAVPWRISRLKNSEEESQSLTVKTSSGMLPPVLVAGYGCWGEDLTMGSLRDVIQILIG